MLSKERLVVQKEVNVPNVNEFTIPRPEANQDSGEDISQFRNTLKENAKFLCDCLTGNENILVIVDPEFRYYTMVSIDDPHLKQLVAARPSSIGNVLIKASSQESYRSQQNTQFLRQLQNLASANLISPHEIASYVRQAKSEGKKIVYIQSVPGNPSETMKELENMGITQDQAFEYANTPGTLNLGDQKPKWVETGKELKKQHSMFREMIFQTMVERGFPAEKKAKLYEILDHLVGKSESARSIPDLINKIAKHNYNVIKFSHSASGFGTYILNNQEARILHLLSQSKSLQKEQRYQKAFEFLTNQINKKALTTVTSEQLESVLTNPDRGVQIQQAVSGLNGKEISISMGTVSAEMSAQGISIAPLCFTKNLVDSSDNGHFGNSVTMGNAFGEYFKDTPLANSEMEFYAAMQMYISMHYALHDPEFDPSNPSTFNPEILNKISLKTFAFDIRFDDGGFPVIIDPNIRPNGNTPFNAEAHRLGIHEYVSIQCSLEAVEKKYRGEEKSILQSENEIETQNFLTQLLTDLRQFMTIHSYPEDSIILQSVFEAKKHMLVPTIFVKLENDTEQSLADRIQKTQTFFKTYNPDSKSDNF